SGIHRAIRVAPDSPIDGAYVEARAASNAVERLAQHRIREHRTAPVVENNHVHFARPVELALTPRSGDETGVGGELLPGRGARKDLEEVAEVLELRNYFFNSHHRDKCLRHCAGEASIAFV